MTANENIQTGGTLDRFKSIQVPETLLILGVDASGKNHVANLIAETLTQAGFDVEKREGGFSEKVTNAVSSENKSALFLFMEKFFISTLHLTQGVIPAIAALLIKKDLRSAGRSKNKTIVISHTALRILVLYLGNRFGRREDIEIPAYLDRALKSIKAETGVKTIVLDVSDPVRKQRISSREKDGKVDNLDIYMAADSIRAERIEDFMIWIGETYLDAVTIENNDLTDTELRENIHGAFCRFV